MREQLKSNLNIQEKKQRKMEFLKNVKKEITKNRKRKKEKQKQKINDKEKKERERKKRRKGRIGGKLFKMI